MVHITTALQPYLPYAGVAMNWRMCGPNGHITRPVNGSFSIIKSYTSCVPGEDWYSTRVRIIANTDYTSIMGPDPHTPLVINTNTNVDVSFRPLARHHTEQYNNHTMLLYHYMTQSYEDFLKKIKRGSGDRGKRSTAEYAYAQNMSTEIDYRLAVQAIIAEQTIQFVQPN